MLVFWFRRDLRLEDNAGLYYALREGKPVLPFFVYDRHILDPLTDQPLDMRVSFIHRTNRRLHQQLQALGSGLYAVHDFPEEAFPRLFTAFPQIEGVIANHDYDPYSCARDQKVAELCRQQGVYLATYKDHVIREKDEVLSKSKNAPYTVFTPYSKAWHKSLETNAFAPYPTGDFHQHFHRYQAPPLPELPEMGFQEYTGDFPPLGVSNALLHQYEAARDYPAENATSRQGVHLRFGTLSPRALAAQAQKHSHAFLNELVWRDFYHQILYHFPQVVEHSFRPEFDQVAWRDSEEDFQRWCAGETGFPMVDAGMRQLNQTGYMHNRLRMVTASFLTKHLLIHWRHGEAYFGKKLLDYELSSNNGGWQWAAGSGTDAAPYFRIFNPETQVKRFDPKGRYIKTWVPEWGTERYPSPMVDHKLARQRALDTFKAALKG
jgi:deoxyribodipyrimidine photo-lyase